MARRKRLALAAVLVSAGLVAWLLARMDAARAGELLRRADWAWLLLALACTCALPACNTVRWMGVLRAQEGVDIGFPAALRAVLIALVLNSFLPSKSGDMAKAFYLRRHGGLARGAGTVVLERLADLFVLACIGLIGYALSGAAWGLVGGCALLAVVAGAFGLVFLFPAGRLPASIVEKAESFRGVFRQWVRQPVAIAQTMAGSAATWLLAGTVVGCLARALDRAPAWGYTFGIYPLAVLAGLFPATISGIGTRDAAFAQLLRAELPLEEATLVALGYTLFVYWLLSLIACPVVFVEIRRFFREDRRL